MNKIISKLQFVFAIIVVILFFVSEDTSLSVLNWVIEMRVEITERGLEQIINHLQKEYN